MDFDGTEIHFFTQSTEEWQAYLKTKKRSGLFADLPGTLTLYPLPTLKNMPESKWFIKGLLQEHEQNFYIGESGAGKTAVVSSMLWSWVTGRPYFLEKRFEIDQSVPLEERRVLYILLEGAGTYWKRAEAWLGATGESEKALERIGLATDHVSFFAPNMLQKLPASLEQLRSAIELFKPQVVVVDTLSRATPGANENSSDMGLVISAFQDLIRDYGVTVIVQHHPSRAKTGLPRGWSGLDGAAGVIIQVTHSGSVRTLEVKKYRNAEEPVGPIVHLFFAPEANGSFTVRTTEAPTPGPKAVGGSELVGLTLDDIVEAGLSSSRDGARMMVGRRIKKGELVWGRDGRLERPETKAEEVEDV
jgi:hypothetical protein